MSARDQSAGGMLDAADEERRARDLLARFFAGFGLVPGAHLERLIGRFMARAAGRRDGEATDFAPLALATAETELEAWFAPVLGEAAGEGVDALLVGRAAWRACGAALRWPEALLAQDPPAACIEAVRAAVPLPVPLEQPGAMLEQRFEAWAPRDLLPRAPVARLLPRRSAAA